MFPVTEERVYFLVLRREYVSCYRRGSMFPVAEDVVCFLLQKREYFCNIIIRKCRLGRAKNGDAMKGALFMMRIGDAQKCDIWTPFLE